MVVNNPNSIPLITSNVWSAATRTITGLGTSLVNGIGDSRASVSNGASTGLTPGIGVVEFVTFLGIGLTNVTWNLQMTNGVNVDSFLLGASGSAISANFVQNHTFSFQITNAGTVAGTFSDTRIRFTS